MSDSPNPLPTFAHRTTAPLPRASHHDATPLSIPTLLRVSGVVRAMRRALRTRSARVDRAATRVDAPSGRRTRGDGRGYRTEATGAHGAANGRSPTTRLHSVALIENPCSALAQIVAWAEAHAPR